MRIEKTHEVVKPTVETLEQTITCNRCGHDTTFDPESHNFEQDKYHEFYCHFGYGSSYDMEQWTFDLCEDCLVDIVKTFKYVPSGFRLDQSFAIVEDESEEHQKLFDHWKETGEWDEIKFKSYEEILGLKDIFTENFIDNVIKERFPDKYNKEENENE